MPRAFLSWLGSGLRGASLDSLATPRLNPWIINHHLCHLSTTIWGRVERSTLNSTKHSARQLWLASKFFHQLMAVSSACSKIKNRCHHHWHYHFHCDCNCHHPCQLGVGRLTSLGASFARCFAFWRTSSKTSTPMFFQNNRQDIASLRKKHDVLHDVFCFRNPIQSYDKSLVI